MFNLETKLQKQFAKDHDKNFIVPNNCVVICPWIIRNGFQNVAENGYLSKNANPRYYGFFQKIFTGNESITATWEGSTYLTKFGPAEFRYNFQVGKYYFGVPIIGSATGGVSIENVESNEDYLGMKEEGTVTIRVEGWVPTREDKYKLYTIPDLYGAQWFFISEVKYLNDLQWAEGVDSTNIPVVEVTFTTLVDKLQNSGKAVEQYVQYAAPGEPYVVPVVFNRDLNAPQPNPDGQLDGEQWIEPYKEVSYIPYQAVSTNYLQIELQGANAISGIQIVGRTLTLHPGGYYISSPWKYLLPYRMIANQVNEINRTSLPSRNFYWFPNGSLDFVTSKTFQQSIKERDDALATNQAAGKLEMDTAEHWYNISDQDARIGQGLHFSNPTIDGLHFDYNNTAWYPQLYYGVDKDHDTTGNFYCVDNLQYTDEDSMLSLLTKNGFIFDTQYVLPLGFKSSKPYHIGTIPIIGGIISKFYGDFSINPNTTQRKPLEFGYFVDCDVAGMLVNIFDQLSIYGENPVYCPIDALVGDETKASKYLGTTALNTTIAFELTDQVRDTKLRLTPVTVDTVNFGQTKYANGQYIQPTKEPYLYGRDGQSPHKKEENHILVIDQVTVFALHKGKVKLSGYYDPDTPTWTTTINSKANWTDSVRDWATTITTGGWGSEWCDWSAADWPWPERPAKTSNPKVEFNFNPMFVSEREATDNHVNMLVSDYWRNRFNRKTYFGDESFAGCSQEPWDSEEMIWNYSDLNVSGVTDKASFKNYFQNIKLPINSTLQIKNENDEKWELQYNGNIEFDIDQSDNYSKTIDLIGFGTIPAGVNPLVKEDTERIEDCCNQDGRDERLISANSGCVYNQAEANITLQDNTFTIRLKYHLHAIGHKDGWKSVIQNSNTIRFAGNHSSMKEFTYNHKQQVCEFVPKGIEPTGYYLAGGSKLLGGYRYSVGQDDKIWYLYHNGEVVTPDSMGISYVTIPPGLGNATYERVGDGLRVKWTSSQTTMDFEIYVNAVYGAEQVREKVRIIIV